MQEFAILYHEMPLDGERASHWDFLLQDGDRLLTWELNDRPEPEQKIVGRQLADHDLRYLNYEGEISGGRGFVSRLARGKFEWIDRPQNQNWQIRMFVGDETWRVRMQRISDQLFEFCFARD